MSLAPAPRQVVLHVEELVLDGYAPAVGHRIGDALRGELARLLAQEGVPAPLRASRHVRRMDAVLEACAAGTPDRIGLQLARAVYRSLAG